MPPDPDSEYLALMRETRRTMLRNGRRVGAQQLNSLFMDLSEDLMRASNFGDTITSRDQARRLREHVIRTLWKLEDRIAMNTQSGLQITVGEMSDMHRRVLTDLGEEHGVELASSLGGLQTDVLASFKASGGTARTFRTLMHRHVMDAAPQVDRVLEKALTLGKSHRQVTEALARQLVGHPDFEGDLSSPLRKLKLEDLRELGIGPSSPAGLRKLYYDAKRISISTINNGYRETNAVAMQRSPVVRAVKWQLSGRHHVRDRCDELAEEDSGHGPGFYLPEEWPQAPHPFCACYQGAVKTRPPSEWGQAGASTDKPRPPPPEVQGMARAQHRDPVASERGRELAPKLRNAFLASNSKAAMRDTADAMEIPGVGGKAKPNISYHYKKNANFAGEFRWNWELGTGVGDVRVMNDAKITIRRDRDQWMKTLREGLAEGRYGEGVTIENVARWADDLEPIGISERVRGAEVINGLHAYRTVVHEHNHAESLFKFERGSDMAVHKHPLRLAIDEGLTELRAREFTTQAFLQESYRDARSRGSRVTKQWTSYDPYVDAFVWVDDELGEDVSQAVWEAGRTDRRIKVLAESVRDKVREAVGSGQLPDDLLEARDDPWLGDPQPPKRVLEDMDDEELVEQLFVTRFRASLNRLFELADL